MRVSVTERQTYKRCRRKWEYSSYNRQSLSPIINAPALDLGTVIHAVLAQWTDEPTLDPIALYETTALTHLQSVVTSYTERIGCAPSQAELMPTLEAISLGQHMIQNYQTKWRSPLPAGYTLIQNELSLVQPVPGTEHCECLHSIATTGPRSCDCIGCILYEGAKDVCGKNASAGNYVQCKCLVCHELECTFDGVMADANGDLYIIERKTFSRTPNVDELNQNDQFLAYQWALSQVYPGKVVGVAYDGLLKKPAPSGVHKSLDDLFLRRLLLRPQAELDEFGHLLSLELLEMAQPNLPIYKTVPFMGCQKWECSYMQVCQAQSRGEPTDDLLKMFVKTDRKRHLDIET
jgi:hypothetical protein